MTRLVSTVAGYHEASDGAAAVARFRGPAGAAISSDGAFALVADTGNHTIRKIALATGMVTTIAGSAGASGSADGIGAAARFYAPGGVAISANGAFALVADTVNNTIRRIDLTTGRVSTPAGDPTAAGSADGIGAAARFFSPSSVAISTDGTFALVADTDNHTIRRIDLIGGLVTTLVGIPGMTGDTDGSSNRALFNRPTGVALGGGDHPFALVADQLNSTIRRVDLSTRVVTTLAGITGDDGDADGVTGEIRFTMPTSVAVSADGTRALVADTGNGSIREIVLESDQVQATTLALSTFSEAAPAAPGTPITFVQPVGVALTADGSRGIAVDLARSTVTLIDVENQHGQRFGSAEPTPIGTPLNGPEGVAVSGDGHIALIANTVTQTIESLSLYTGTTAVIAGSPGVFGSADGVGPEASFSYPAGIALSADGALAVVADRDSHTIRLIDLSSDAVTTLAGSVGVAGMKDEVGIKALFTMPQAVALSRNKSYVLVADSYNHAIRRIDMTTRAVTTLAGGQGVSGADNGIGGAARFNMPSGVAICDVGGYALVSDTGNNTIRRISLSTREVTTLAGRAGVAGSGDGRGAAARFDGPRGLAIDDTCMQALVTDSYNHTIRRIDLATGDVTTLFGAAGFFGSADGLGTAARFDTPTGVAMTANGKRVLAADMGNSAIRYVGGWYLFLPEINR